MGSVSITVLISSGSGLLDLKDVSSVNSLVNAVKVLLMSFIYTRYKRGPRADHCDTPAFIFLPDDVPFLYFTFCSPSVK